MKKWLFFIPVLALIATSCSSEEPATNDVTKPEYAGATSYLNINLRPASGMGHMGVKGTRADSYQQGDGTYEDGSESENNITRVRFYFFNEDGEPFSVRLNLATNEYDNFIDWYPNDSEIGGPNHNNETIEKTLTATIGLTFPDEEEVPAKVLAVANPTNEILTYTTEDPQPDMSLNSMSLEELQGIVTDYLPYSNNNFVMSNSVYVANGKAVYTTDLADNNFQPNPTEAAKPDNIVTIYIERVLARVDFGIDLEEAELEDADEGTYYFVGNYTINDVSSSQTDEPFTDEPIYVKFLGWNVTSTTGTSRLIKDINPKWTDTDIMGNSGILWTTSDYKRSFWAINPNNVQIQYGNFGEVEGEEFEDVEASGQFANALPIPSNNENVVSYAKTYLQENANPYLADLGAKAPTNPSKVIIAAQLVDKNGAPLTICEWGYNKYTLAGLKNQIAKALPNLYYYDTIDDETGWFQIDANMITFTTVDPLGEEQGDKEYYVYAVLTEEAAQKTWALRSGNTYTNFTTEDKGDGVTIEGLVNTYIRGIVNHAMIWNTGLTYYYFDIRHLAGNEKDVAYLGVVRNHLYRTTVTGLTGLGTPVYDPGKDIHPQMPNPGETVIQAKINVLSWRLVSNSYTLNWD